jgi:hypothetical protein
MISIEWVAEDVATFQQIVLFAALFGTRFLVVMPRAQ